MSGLLPALALSALALAQPPSPPPFEGGFPVTDRGRVYELSDVKRGQRGIGYTVFSGDKLEPFGFEVLGVMKSMLGPGKHVILVKLTGEKIEFTGVIAGMSGSPTYIDGRLLGAVAYRFGSFSKEPIAGITPIRSMLDVYSEAVGPKLARGGAAPWSEAGLSVARYHSESLPPLPLPKLAQPASTSAELRPIQTPLLVSGLSATALSGFEATLAPTGMKVAAAGSPKRRRGTLAEIPRDAKAHPVDKNVRGEAGGVPALPIAPGAPIGVPLMRGDLSATAIGTVTMVEGDRVYGFGHPFMGQGHVELPMATASIINTLATPAGSYKQGLAALEVGQISHDRLTAIAGKIGEVPPMVPVRITVRQAGRSRVMLTEVEIVDDPAWFPQLLAQAIASAGGKRLRYEAGGTIDLRAVIHVGDTPLQIVDTAVAPPPYPLPNFAALDVANSASIILNNPFVRAQLRGVEVSLSVSPKVAFERVEEAWASSSVLKPGQPAELQVRLRAYRGGSRVVKLSLPLPKSARGEVSVTVGSGVALDAADERVRGRRQPHSLEALLGILAERRPGRALYARAYLNEPGVTEAATRYSALPPSQRLNLMSEPGARLSGKSLGPGLSLPQALPISGKATVSFEVRP